MQTKKLRRRRRSRKPLRSSLMELRPCVNYTISDNIRGLAKRHRNARRSDSRDCAGSPVVETDEQRRAREFGLSRRLSAKQLARFWKRVQRTESCWIWTGHKAHAGHGQYSVWFKDPECRFNFKAHRLVWMLLRNSSPQGFLCHRCDVPACVNPDHVYEGTQKDNMRDRDERGRHANAAKTHCPAGHPYPAFKRGGVRNCAICRRVHRRISDRRWREKKRLARTWNTTTTNAGELLNG